MENLLVDKFINKPAQQLNIALAAHDVKKELMVRFCIAYSKILSHHRVCATAATGKLVSEATGLRLAKFLDSSQGGSDQISSRISCGEIDMFIFFRDASRPELMSRSEENVLRLCDIHNIPLATNIATAEALIHALERGDLDWIKIGCPTV